MSFPSLLMLLWPFIKEIFKGQKVKDPDAPAEKKKGPLVAGEWLKERLLAVLQKSPAAICLLIVLLVASVLINYRLLSADKSFSHYREKEYIKEKQETAPVKETPTIPKKGALFEQTKKELNDLYGEP